ncbi:hypothetical protein KNP414_04577 [Paenibacillus mucilaginosus KNP414]|uniref:Uncharacterized protein n=1 Tax=Paenibacillus mucilaginosus (strain KNP414) TaxID=1036673 RepID=F8FBQ6_PAEMK|nr:hypothetical protein KNP414_04577 [Paenibacillus mucilaginosus KNP414]
MMEVSFTFGRRDGHAGLRKTSLLILRNEPGSTSSADSDCALNVKPTR